MKTLLLFLALVSVSWAGTYTMRLRHITNMGGQLGSVRFRAGESQYQLANGFGIIYDAGYLDLTAGDVVVTVPDNTLDAWEFTWRDIWGGGVAYSVREVTSIPDGAAREAYVTETGNVTTAVDRGELAPPIEDPDPSTGGGSDVSMTVDLRPELTLEDQLQLFFLGFGCALPMLAVSYTLTMARRARQLDGGAS